MKVLITFSSGGHFTEALKATALLTNNVFDKVYVTYKEDHLKNSNSYDERMYLIVHPKHCFFLKRIILFLINSFQSILILVKEKPKFIISTGADVTVPISIIGKLLGIKLIYIESGGQVYSPSLTGKIIYRFADYFFIQWEPQKKFFPKAIVGGPLI